VTHHAQVWKLPPGLDPAAASGLVLTQVGYNVGMRPALQPRQAAVVIGDGLVGHWAAQTLQQRGARVLMVGRHDDRLARFTTVTEADRVVNVSREQDLLAAVVQQWAVGDGVQVVADTVGSIPAVESLLPVMRRDGHIASAGFYGRNGLIDIQKLREREITLHAPAGWTKERMDATLDWVARGALQTLPLLTHRFPVARASAVYDLILARNEPVLGVLLDWS
jgi:2-desacetyl-2-hydroxyethyl bacteriochlorophyllide A dehydrogenase